MAVKNTDFEPRINAKGREGEEGPRPNFRGWDIMDNVRQESENKGGAKKH